MFGPQNTMLPALRRNVGKGAQLYHFFESFDIKVTYIFKDSERKADDDDGRINFNVAYSPKTSRTRNS